MARRIIFQGQWKRFSGSVKELLKECFIGRPDEIKEARNDFHYDVISEINRLGKECETACIIQIYLVLYTYILNCLERGGKECRGSAW